MSKFWICFGHHITHYISIKLIIYIGKGVLGIENKQGEGFNIMAIADMDSDGFADIITINSSEDSFTVHYYDPEKFIYKNLQPS